ncbi:hypothetical protein Tco_0954437 [Tanacetum coccineum]|uniref:Uncharacterized protein n=1 Tax=Tanacetum coccineum TaxID=301880 RepID=A0ABQ5E3U9_9ASTR
MFLKYSTGLIPPKKSRGKGSQGKKTVDVSQESVDVSDESEPEPAKKKTGSRTEQEAVDTMQARKPAKDSQVLKVQVKKLVGYQGFPITPQSSLLPQVMELKKDNDGDVDDEDEDDDHISDIQDTDDEDAKTESDKDEISKANVEKTAEENGDVELAGNAMISDYQVKESTKLPLPSSSLSVSSRFGTHFLNLSSDMSLTGVLKDSIQSPSILKFPVSVILETTTLPPIPEIPTETSVSTTLSPPHVTPTISIVQQTTTPIPTSPITTKDPTITTVVPESDALTAVQLRVIRKGFLTVVEHYLGSEIGDDLQKVLQRHTADLIQTYCVNPTPEPSKIQKPKIDLVPESKKSAS